MNEAKHTPGPWEFRDVVGAGRQIYGNPGRMKVEGMTETTGEGPVMLFGVMQQPAMMFAFDRWVQFPTDQWEAMQEANARLIAASPTLLAACEAWVQYFDQLDAQSDPDDPMAKARAQYHRKRIDATRAAILLAKGTR